MNEEWRTSKLHSVADVRVSNVDKKFYATETPVRLCNYMDVYTNDYVTTAIDFMTASASKAQIERFGLMAGDVVITKDSETPDDIGVSAVIAEQISGLVCGYHLALIRPRDEAIDPVYLAKHLRSSRSIKYFAANASGSTRFGLSISAIENLEIPLAPRPEQTIIGEILATVDRAIEQTEVLIAKQQRIKCGLMQDLLTRGIDEHGDLRSEQTHQFKDSALGRIPAEWEVRPLSSVVDLTVGYAFKSSWFTDDGLPLLRGENVGHGRPDWKECRCIPHSIASRFSDYILYLGDIIIGMDRTFTKLGFKVSVLGENDVASLLVQRVGRFVPVAIPRGFMKLLIQSPGYQRELALQQKGMDIPHLSKREILNPLVPVPSSDDEMNGIASRVDSLDKSQQINKSHLNKLQLLKSALMQDLLTGKRRVTALLNQPEQVGT